MSSEKSPKKTEERRGNRWTNQPIGSLSKSDNGGELTYTSGTTLDIGRHDLERMIAQGLTFRITTKF